MNHPLDEVADEMRADEPRITDAMKNYISYLGALIGQAEDGRPQNPPDLVQLTTCAKVALKQCNAHRLQSSAEWAGDNPQGEHELGSDRIEALTRYKACVLLAGQVASAGGKVTKLLGRKYLRATKAWGEVAPVVASELLALGIPSGVVERFVEGFSRTLEETKGEGEDIASLVWSSDFQAQLRARQQARQAEISERRERMQGNQDQSAMLREALRGGMEEEAEDEAERFVEVGDTS